MNARSHATSRVLPINLRLQYTPGLQGFLPTILIGAHAPTSGVLAAVRFWPFWLSPTGGAGMQWASAAPSRGGAGSGPGAARTWQTALCTTWSRTCTSLSCWRTGRGRSFRARLPSQSGSPPRRWRVGWWPPPIHHLQCIAAGGVSGRATGSNEDWERRIWGAIETWQGSKRGQEWRNKHITGAACVQEQSRKNSRHAMSMIFPFPVNPPPPPTKGFPGKNNNGTQGPGGGEGKQKTRGMPLSSHSPPQWMLPRHSWPQSSRFHNRSGQQQRAGMKHQWNNLWFHCCPKYSQIWYMRHKLRVNLSQTNDSYNVSWKRKRVSVSIASFKEWWNGNTFPFPWPFAAKTETHIHFHC